MRRASCRRAYFLLRRCTRVRLSSLRCFFFAIRLRRFLMTEPTTNPLPAGPAPTTYGGPAAVGNAGKPSRSRKRGFRPASFSSASSVNGPCSAGSGQLALVSWVIQPASMNASRR